ncbi:MULTISPECIES: HalOD1 output domain-containing protein [Halorussus]|uniref:HalOD1 output domain-containing protein n=1 Tax=Halorussus TaxID=1070314 RepID=UPI00209E6324|nr:HalOD1 output domain-containing protein [Halorussus vallis]USZ78706.1 hypothetical protein NGM07_24660 [Halorussus vallis]
MNRKSEALHSIEYNSEIDAYVTSFGPGTPPSEAIITTIADIQDCDPLELPPLPEVIAPDALDKIFQVSQGGGTPPEGQLIFQYCDHQITVKATGIVTLHSL